MQPQLDKEKDNLFASFTYQLTTIVISVKQQFIHYCSARCQTYEKKMCNDQWDHIKVVHQLHLI